LAEGAQKMRLFEKEAMCTLWTKNTISKMHKDGYPLVAVLCSIERLYCSNDSKPCDSIQKELAKQHINANVEQRPKGVVIGLSSYGDREKTEQVIRKATKRCFDDVDFALFFYPNPKRRIIASN